MPHLFDVESYKRVSKAVFSRNDACEIMKELRDEFKPDCCGEELQGLVFAEDNLSESITALQDAIVELVSSITGISILKDLMNPGVDEEEPLLDRLKRLYRLFQKVSRIVDIAERIWDFVVAGKEVIDSANAVIDANRKYRDCMGLSV